jgi:uncharacterized membrane protein
VAKLTRVRAIPWLLVFEAARTVRSHVMDSLSPKERRRVAEILRASHGNPMRVTEAQRKELRAIAGKLDVKKLGRDLVPHAVSHARRRGRKS